MYPKHIVINKYLRIKCININMCTYIKIWWNEEKEEEEENNNNNNKVYLKWRDLSTINGCALSKKHGLGFGVSLVFC